PGDNWWSVDPATGQEPYRNLSDIEAEKQSRGLTIGVALGLCCRRRGSGISYSRAFERLAPSCGYTFTSERANRGNSLAQLAHGFPLAVERVPVQRYAAPSDTSRPRASAAVWQGFIALSYSQLPTTGVGNPPYAMSDAFDEFLFGEPSYGKL